MSSSKPPPPDPNVGLAAQGQAEVALRAEARAEANDAYFRENFAPRYLEQIDQQIATGKEAQQFQMGLARKYDQRYWDTTAKFQDKFYSDVDRFDTEAAREEYAGKAAADVQRGSDAAAAIATRGLQRQGVNPNSGAMLGIRRQYAQSNALGRAAAMTMARDAARREGMSLKAAAAGLGGNLTAATQGMSGLAGMSGAAGIQALNAGTGALQGQTSGFNQTLGLAQGAYAGVGNLGMGLTNQANQHALANAQNQNQIYGSLAGAAMTAAMMYSDRRLKTNVRRIATRCDGTGLYEFEYIWGGPKRIGVMADEVLQTRPEAVVQIGGFYAVDYARL